MISTLFECTCCKSPNGNDVATKDRHFESFESKYFSNSPCLRQLNLCYKYLCKRMKPH